MTIGGLARRVGVTPEAIRYYERSGVLENARRDSHGHRRYGRRAVDELRLLRAAQAVGFSLEEIGRMLALTRQDPVPCRSVCDLVEHRVAELDERIDELRRARERLAHALASCNDGVSCVVPEQLAAAAPTPEAGP